MKSLGLAIGCLCASMSVHAVGISGQGTWETTLQARDLDGNLTTAEAYFDTVLGITWLADASYVDQNVPWSSALNLSMWLNPYESGIAGWRVPRTNPIDGTTGDDDLVSYIGSEDRGFNVSAPGTVYAGSTASEMAHLFYNTLGNLSYCDPATSTMQTCSGPQDGWGLSNTGPFSNIQDRSYWSETPAYISPPQHEYAWTFVFATGDQAIVTTYVYDVLRIWAVHDGDVGTPIITSAVPLPASAWLLGSGLLCLLGLPRGKHVITNTRQDS